MADISKIKTLDGTTYDIKDAVARGKRTISYTSLFSRATISGTGSKTLNESVANYDALAVIIYNGTGASDRKTYFIPSIMYANKSDVSWNATDSVGWYANITLTFSGTSMNINKFEKAGFTAIQISVYGISVL